MGELRYDVICDIWESSDMMSYVIYERAVQIFVHNKVLYSSVVCPGKNQRTSMIFKFVKSNEWMEIWIMDKVQYMCVWVFWNDEKWKWKYNNDIKQLVTNGHTLLQPAQLCQ